MSVERGLGGVKESDLGIDFEEVGHSEFEFFLGTVGEVEFGDVLHEFGLVMGGNGYSKGGKSEGSHDIFFCLIIIINWIQILLIILCPIIKIMMQINFWANIK